MHGEPGSGKSTVARALAPRIDAVVLDKDVLKAELLHAGLADPDAGRVAYDLFFAVAADLLAQDRSLILDSPVFWPMVEERSLAVARAAGARYLMIETVCLDGAELARRLATRDALASQPREIRDWLAIPGTIEPSCERLRVDTTHPLGQIVDDAMAYVLANAPRPKDVAHSPEPAHAISPSPLAGEEAGGEA
jgi:predicted kinase